MHRESTEGQDFRDMTIAPFSVPPGPLMMNAHKLAINKIVRLCFFLFVSALAFVCVAIVACVLCGNYAGKKNHTLRKFK